MEKKYGTPEGAGTANKNNGKNFNFKSSFRFFQEGEHSRVNHQNKCFSDFSEKNFSHGGKAIVFPFFSFRAQFPLSGILNFPKKGI